MSSDSQLKLKADCVRRVANWTRMAAQHKFDKKQFNPEQVLQDMEKMSPKMIALLDNIKQLDAQDLEKHGKHFKHFIFSDVKQGGYGSKIITSAMLADGFNLAYDTKLELHDDKELMKTKGNNLALLCSTSVFEKPVGVKVKKSILTKYNSRPENVHGDLVRFIIMDSGFKEGIDLFDVKYVHIFEPQTSKADQKQVIGRGTRTCGQKGLEFHPTRGWPLNVYVYDVGVPHTLRDQIGAETLFKSYMIHSGIDLRRIAFADELERMSIVGSVDYELNKNIHRFKVEDDFDLPDLFDGGAVSSATEVKCDKNCGRMRPTKDVPVSLAQLSTAYLALGYELPKTMKKEKLPRLFFCEVLKKDKNFCANVQAIFKDPRGFVVQQKKALIEAVEKNRHRALPSSPRVSFLRFVFSIIPRPTKLKAVLEAEMKNVKDSTPNSNSNSNSNANSNTPSYNSNANSNANANAVSTPNNSSVIPNNSKTPEEKLLTPPVPNKRMNFIQTREYVKEHYSQYTWPKVKLENLCGGSGTVRGLEYGLELSAKMQGGATTAAPIQIQSGQMGVFDSISGSARPVEHVIPVPQQNFVRGLDVGMTLAGSFKPQQGGGSHIMKLSPTQDFVRRFFTAESPQKGMLLWHSVGVGKTCAAIATASDSFERAGYTILWVTRTTLKSDIWKNMFDQVCSIPLQNKMKAGFKMPSDGADRMKLLSPSWSIRPMSYKQFSNLVAKKNDFYKALVKKNGEEDPLRKTLLIIDEAHKLYGGTDLSSVERPDMEKFHAAIMNSFAKSGKDSVRLLMMTATPFTNDPMELIKLLNLVRDKDEQLPVDYDAFASTYLNENGEFSKKGSRKYLDDIAGYISYLNRERDARQFAQPSIVPVYVDMSTSSGLWSIDQIKEHFGVDMSNLKDELNDLKMGLEDTKAIAKEKLKALKEACKGLKKEARKECLEKVEQEKKMVQAELVISKEAFTESTKQVKQEMKDVKAKQKKKLEDRKADPNQEDVIQTKCIDTGKKPKSKKQIKGAVVHNMSYTPMSDSSTPLNAKSYTYLYQSFVTYYNVHGEEIEATPNVFQAVKGLLQEDVESLGEGGLASYIDSIDGVVSIVPELPIPRILSIKVETNKLLTSTEKTLLLNELRQQMVDGWGAGFTESFEYSQTTILFGSVNFISVQAST